MSMKLLIVDDDLPFRERLTRSMEKKGFDVESSFSFKESLNKVNIDWSTTKKVLLTSNESKKNLNFINFTL